MENNQYLTQRRNRLLQYFRLRLGIVQLINRPFLNVLLIPIVILSVLVWKGKERLLVCFDVPEILLPAFQFSVLFIAIMIPLLLLLLLLETIGKLTARKDELALLIAFDQKQLRNGCPILMSKKRQKETNVIRREYYSDIPLHIWEKNKNAIADAMNIRFIEEIQYGGRANGKRIVIYTSSGRKAENREKLYDEEF